MVAPQSPRRRSRDDVADMALRLLDEYGLPDLTMRHLATALGVQPSALYWHFPNKQTLLAAVSQRILSPISSVPIDGLSVYRALRVLGTRMRECLLAYRDASELVSSSLALGLVDPPIRSKVLTAARRQGVPDSLSTVAAEAVMHFVVGFAFHEQQRLAADSLGLIDSGGGLSADDGDDGSAADDDFAAALTMIADGLEASVARGAGPQGERLRRSRP